MGGPDVSSSSCGGQEENLLDIARASGYCQFVDLLGQNLNSNPPTIF